MTVSLKHKFASAKTDGADTSLVRPSNWNDEHDLVIDTAKIVGRTTAGTGSAEEIAVSAELTLAAGSLGIASSIGGKTLTGPTVIDVNSSSTALRVTQTGAGNAFVVEDSASTDATPFVIDAGGNVGIGTATPLVKLHAQADTSLGLLNYTAGGGTSYLFRRSSGTLVAPTIVGNGEAIAVTAYQGYDGAAFISAATISGVTDGVPGTNDMPGRLVFSTTADGASTPTERMRIDSAGQVGIGTTPSAGVNFVLGKALTGSTTPYAMLSGGVIQADATANPTYFSTFGSTVAGSYAVNSITHYNTQFAGFGAGSSAATQIGYSVGASLVGATNNYGFYGAIPAATGRWNAYMAGTADNYFAGRVGIATATPTFHHQVALASDTNNRGIAVTETTYTANFRAVYINYWGVSATGSTYGISNANLGALVFQNTANALIGTNNFVPIIFATNSLERMRVDGDGRVGIGTAASTATSLHIAKNVTGATVAYQQLINGTVQSDVTSINHGVLSQLNTQATSFVLGNQRHFAATQGTIGAGSSLTNQYGFFADASLTSATFNIGFYGNIPAATNRWNFYAGGTADNYFAGNVGIGTNTPTAKLNVVESGSQDAVRITNTGTGNSFVVEDSANPDASPFVINAAGQTVIGSTAARQTIANIGPYFQIHGLDNNQSAFSMTDWRATGFGGPFVLFAKSKGGAVGTRGILSNGERLGNLQWGGDDGVAFIPAAAIEAQVDGVPGLNDMPGRIMFATTADGAASPTERMRINSAGAVMIGGSTASGSRLTITQSDSTTAAGNFEYSQYDISSPSGTGAKTGRSTLMVPAAGYAGTHTIIGTSSNLSTLSTTGFNEFRGFGSSYTSSAAGAATSYSAFDASSITLTSGTLANAYGVLVRSNFVGSTNTYGFRGDIPAATGRWNFYAGGTADNYFAGKVGIGNATPAVSAALDVTSTTAGVLFPRMTTTQRDAISTPVDGLVVFNTTAVKLQVRAGGAWVDLH